MLADKKSHLVYSEQHYTTPYSRGRRLRNLQAGSSAPRTAGGGLPAVCHPQSAAWTPERRDREEWRKKGGRREGQMVNKRMDGEKAEEGQRTPDILRPEFLE